MRNLTIPLSASRSGRSLQLGFSLIEIMVAMAIALLLLLGLTVMFVNASSNYRELNNASRQLENGRFALQIMREDLRHAGFYGYYMPDPIAAPALVDPCAITAAVLQTSVRSLHVQGYNDTAPPPDATCLPGKLPDTNVLLVIRASTNIHGNTDDTTGLDAGTIYIQSTYDEALVGTGDNTAQFNLRLNTPNDDPATIRRMVAHTYYVRDCNVCAPDSDGIPTLWRRELGGPAVPIAEGIEYLFLRYGVDTNNDGNPNNYLQAHELATGDWSNIVTVDINILARNPEESREYTDTRSYALGGGDDNGGITLPPPGDSFKRQVFSAVARIENISQRRERQ
ncbi:MAG: PilW family protein [Gammaproteobacteria bacterium]|nr:PilW family protein [Gammaproteobacteria bacterium]